MLYGAPLAAWYLCEFLAIVAMNQLEWEEKFTVNSLKTLDTICNCLRPVFSLSVSQHMHKKKKTCENLISIGRRSCEITMKEKNTIVTRSCVLLDA